MARMDTWCGGFRRRERNALPSGGRYAILPYVPGAVAQLGERLVRNQQVRGSSPLGSIRLAANCGEPNVLSEQVFRTSRRARPERAQRVEGPVLSDEAKESKGLSHA